MCCMCTSGDAAMRCRELPTIIVVRIQKCPVVVVHRQPSRPWANRCESNFGIISPRASAAQLKLVDDTSTPESRRRVTGEVSALTAAP